MANQSLFCFGLGYSAKNLSENLMAEGWSVSGTCRDADQAATLRQTAEALEAEAPDTVRFTRAIKEEVPYEERFNVVRALWQVVLADGARDAEEDALMRLLASLLGVNDRDSALARQRA